MESYIIHMILKVWFVLFSMRISFSVINWKVLVLEFRICFRWHFGFIKGDRAVRRHLYLVVMTTTKPRTKQSAELFAKQTVHKKINCKVGFPHHIANNDEDFGSITVMRVDDICNCTRNNQNEKCHDNSNQHDGHVCLFCLLIGRSVAS